MSPLGTLPIPTAPHFALDWAALDARFEWIRAMAGCAQDPVWHAEGDVWIHTRMVCEALLETAEWRALDAEDRAIAFAAALLHDVAKPEVTRVVDGRITSRGHSGRGENVARVLLAELGADLSAREEVVRIIESHQLPFFAIDQASPAARLHRLAEVARPSLVALVAEADARGRVAVDQARLLDQIDLFRELARDEGVLRGARPFASTLARYTYFHRPETHRDYVPHDETWGEVVVLSGLPASGKDTWIRERAGGLPVVSLDALREELEVAPDETQGRVVSAAKEQARQHLRAHQPFVWNATNLSRQHRAPLIALIADYGAQVNLVYREVPPDEQRARNRSRERQVPSDVLAKMRTRWQVPDRTEAHRVSWNDGAAGPRAAQTSEG